MHGLTLFKGYNVQAFSLSELAALWDCWGSTVKDCAKLQYSELPFLWFSAFRWLKAAISCLNPSFFYHGCHNLKVWVIVEVVMPFLTPFQITFTKATYFPICGKDVRSRSDSPPIDVLYRPLWISDLTGFLLLLIANLLYKQMILLHVMVLKKRF